MKKLLYGLIALFLVSVALANPGHLGVYQTKNWLGFPIYALDTTAGLRHRPDSVYLYVYFGRLANASSFTARSANPVSETYIDSFKTSSQAEATFMYHDSVGRIDADSGNGNYWALLQAYYQTKITDFAFQFTVVDSPYATSLRKAAQDSSLVDGSVLAGLTGSISATTIAADAIGSSELATDAIGAAEIAAGAITSAEATSVGTATAVTTVNGLAAGVITATSIATDAITDTKIAAGAITSSEIATDAIGAAELAADAIGASEIAAGAIVAGTEATGFSTLTATDNIGINWADVSNPTTTVGLSGTTILKSSNVDNIASTDTLTQVLNVANIASTDTLTTILGNVNGNVAGSVGSVTGAVGSVTGNVGGNVVGSVASVTGAVGSVTGNVGGNVTGSVGSLTTNNDKTGYALTTSYPDSSGLSRILGRKLFGIAAGTGSDSLTKAQRIVGASQASDTINAHAPHGNNFASTGASAVTPDTIRDILGDSLATFASPHALTDSMRLVAHDSARAFVQGVKDKTDSLKFAGVLQNPSFLQPTTSGRRLDVTATGEAGIDLDNTAGTLAKTTDITGFNDIAATAVVSGGAITTSGGAVSTVTTTTTATNVTTVNGLAANTITATSIQNDALTAAKIADLAIDSNTFALDARKLIAIRADSGASGSGASAADVWTYGTRTLTSGAVAASLYPIVQNVTTIDAPGTLSKYQFEIDSTSAGGSNEYGLLNTTVLIRDADDGHYYFNGIIERVNCVADQCTLQVSDSCAFAFEAGDSVWMYRLRPEYVIASLSEAAAAVASTSLEGAYADSTLGGLLKLIAEGAGAAGFDSTLFLEMLANHGWYATFDTLGLRVTRGNSYSGPVLADMLTIPDLESSVLPVDLTQVQGDTATASGLKEAFDTDAIGYGRTTYVDSAGNAGGSSSSGCPDSVGNAWTIVAWDSVNNVEITDAIVTLKSSATSTTPLAQAIAPFTFTAASATYYVATEANNVTFPLRSFAISTSRTDTINGGGLTVLTPSSPSLCAIQGVIKDLNNNYIVGAKVTFTLESALDTLHYGSAEFIPFSKTVVTNASGYFSLELMPNSLIDSNSKYIFKVEKTGVSGLPRQRRITVPASASANIDDL